MKRYVLLLLLLFIPSVCFADGISVQTWTLAASPFSFLVKVIAIDSLKYKAKIKILKKYHTQNSVSDQSAGIFPADVFSKEQSKQITYIPPVPWEQLTSDAEFTIKLKQPEEPQAGKWVIEDQYWDSADPPKAGEKAFIVSRYDVYSWVKHTAFNEKKFDYVYDLDLRNKKLNSASIDDLVDLVKDADLQAFVMAELEKRKSIEPSFFFRPELKDKFIWILRDYFNTNEPIEQKKLILPFLHYLKNQKQKVTDETRASFLSFLTYLPSDLVDFEEVLEIGSVLKYQKIFNTQARSPINYEIQALHSKVKDIINAKKPVRLSMIFDQALDALIYENSPRLDLETIYNNTSPEDRHLFYQKQAQKLEAVGFKNQSSSLFSSIAFKLKSEPDLAAAKTLMKMNLSEAPTNIKVAILEGVFESMTRLGDMKNMAEKKSLLKFMDENIDHKNPSFLEQSVMKRYLELSKR